MPIADFLPNLPAEVAREILERLRAALPLPVPDTPEMRAARETTAFSAVAALQTADAGEASLAALIIATQAQHMECLRLAALMRHDVKTANRFRGMANQMMREARSGLDLLRECQAHARAQAARQPTAAAGVKQRRAERIRGLDLRVIETPPTRH